MTFEKVNVSTAEIRDDWQKKHINPQVDLLRMFSDPNGPIAILVHADDISVPESVRLTLKAANIETCLIHKLHKEIRYGFVAVHFVNRQYSARWDVAGVTHEDQIRIKIACHQILLLMKDLQ
jgi:hypothetical protein